MKLAVLGDIHANLPALESVIAVLRRLAPDGIVCTGDVVGYNAEPAACIDAVRELGAVCVAGNHDEDIATGRASAGTNEIARLVQQWTRTRLDDARLAWLGTMAERHEERGEWLALHGAFLGGKPTLGYVTSTMLEKNLKAIAAMQAAPVAFCGHTHTPLVGWLREGACEEPRIRPGEPISWPRDAEAVLVNPGAVGQPRDGDPRASFALVDLERRTAAWYRVEYPLEHAAQAIARAGLPLSLADRLREGR